MTFAFAFQSKQAELRTSSSVRLHLTQAQRQMAALVPDEKLSSGTSGAICSWWKPVETNELVPDDYTSMPDLRLGVHAKLVVCIALDIQVRLLDSKGLGLILISMVGTIILHSFLHIFELERPQ